MARPARVQRDAAQQSSTDIPRVVLRAPFGLEFWREYRARNAEVFPSDESLRHFLKRHKGSLVEAGALLQWRGELVIDPPKFEDVMREKMRIW
jgi:hypothetical protein